MIRAASVLLLLLLLLPQALHRELMYEGIHVDSISGDQPNSARTAAVDNFRAGKTWVLIATDLIGRGEEHRQCKQHRTPTYASNALQTHGLAWSLRQAFWRHFAPAAHVAAQQLSCTFIDAETGH